MYRKTTEESGRRALDRSGDPDLDHFDPLTGLATRDFYETRIEEAWEQAVHDKTLMSLSLIAIDGVDRQTPMDEELGEQLRAIAEILSALCQRRADFAARMRATEFAVYLAEVNAAGAKERSEVICKQVKDRTGLTVSVGAACFLPTKRRFVRSLYQYADQALRQAQAEGGNTAAVVTESDF